MDITKDFYKIMSVISRKKKSQYYGKYLKKMGVKMGEDVFFSSPRKTWVDITRPTFISIGSHCVITSGVTILAHDWSYSVVMRAYEKMVGRQLWTTIGNNVFIGTNAIVLMGATIGDNVIIGAGSVVSGRVESDSVYAGNPAVKICSMEEYCKKGENRYQYEAVSFIQNFEQKNGRRPEIKELNVYRPLFISKKKDEMDRYYPKEGYVRETVNKIPQLFDNVKDV